MKQNIFDRSYYFGRVYDDYDQFLDFKKLAKDLIKRYRFGSFLDIGCGCGNLAKEVKKELENKYKRTCDIQGIDFSEFAVSKAGVPFVVLADCAKKLPFSDERFDFVHILGTFSYLETIRDVNFAMNEALRVSNKYVLFDDVYDIVDKSHDDYDPFRVRILNQHQWLNLWKKVLNRKGKINLHKEEIVITKFQSNKITTKK